MTKQVMVGGVPIGGGAPVSVQSMTNTDTRDVQATLAQIRQLAAAGCDLIRVAVPDQAAAEAVEEIKKDCPIPLICDIHFDYRLAIACIERGADKIRINPGNIGGQDRVRAVVRAARAHHVPIRVGVNAGSLEKAVLARYGGVTPEGLCESAMSEVALLEAMDFEDIIVSLKSSDVVSNTKACRMMHQMVDYPLHIGVTEAGTPAASLVKSAAGLGALLLEGIGDTMRVSMTGDPLPEVHAAQQILEVCGRRRAPVEIISCPTCGRTQVDLVRLVEQVEAAVRSITPSHPLKVAVMGCEVNGPGEAAGADLGVACGKGRGVLFAHGAIQRTVTEEEIVPALVEMIRSFT